MEQQKHQREDEENDDDEEEPLDDAEDSRNSLSLSLPSCSLYSELFLIPFEGKKLFHTDR